MKKKILAVLFVGILSLSTLAGCGDSKTTINKELLPKANVEIAFSDFGFDATMEEIEDKNGKSLEAYDGIYGGKVLVYNKEYKGLPGKVLYMFNTDGMIADIAWKTTTKSKEKATGLLNELTDELNSSYGEKTFDNTAETAEGGKWEKEDIHILLNNVFTGDDYILQIAYLNENTAILGYIDTEESK